MSKKPTYEELERRVLQLENENVFYKQAYEVRLLSPIAENISEAVIATNKNYKITYMNKQAEDLFGYSFTEIRGQTPNIFNANSAADEIQEKLYKTVSKGKVYAGELLAMKKNGFTFLCQFKMIPIIGYKGEIFSYIGIQRDITAQEKARGDLKNSELKLKEINQILSVVLEHTRMKTVYLDTGFNFIWVNKAYADANNHDPPFFLGKNHFDLYPHEENQAIFQNVVDTGEPHFASAKPFEYPDQPWRGVTYWDWSLIPVKDEAGSVSTLVLTLVEVTNSISSRLEIEENEKHLRALVENTKAIAWELDLETSRFVYISPRIKDLTGYSPEEWKDFDFWAQTIHPEDREAAINFCQTETQKGKDHEFEYRMITTTDKTIWVRDLCTVIMDKGKPISIYGHFLDITERKLFESEIQENRMKLDTALNSMVDGVFISNNAGELIELNEAWAVFSRFQNKDECLRQLNEYPDLFEVFFPNGKPTPIEMWALPRALRGEKKTNVEYTIRRKDTGETWVGAYSFSPILNARGETLGAVVVARDITELKRNEAAQRKLEMKLQQAQRMESIGNLAGGIAHDFNNILFPIVGMAELLIEDLPQDSLEYENALEILRAGKRGGDLVKQILAFSRQTEHKFLPVRIQQILKEALKLTRATIPSNIKMIQNIQLNCGLILADPTKIHQVAMNIITNAYHAVEAKGGTINVQLKEMEFQDLDSIDIGLQSGKYVVLTISDTGQGIPNNHIDKIFDPYFTTKAQGKGTGLGLAMVYGIVQEHRGRITVNSEIGKGTTFKVYLPMMDKSVNAMAIDITENLPTGHERLLVVDDEKPIAILEKQMLERLGYKVTVCLNSPDALKLYRKNPSSFDLVVTDMTMPNMTGKQLVEEIRTINSDIPIIICTGFSERINDEKSNTLGIAGILMKPIVKSEMAKTVRNVLDNAKGQKPIF